MGDRYGSFRELAALEREGEDWAREYLDRGSRILVMAPHGGWIEPLTTELARAVAGNDLSFYTFLGIKDGKNHELHLTSHRFDEPVALEAAARSQAVLAIHGEKTRGRPFIMVGGRETLLREEMEGALVAAAFPVEAPRQGLGGKDPRNICNRGRKGGGVQLEISEGFRDLLRHDGQLLARFVEVVRRVALRWETAEVAEGGDRVP